MQQGRSYDCSMCSPFKEYVYPRKAAASMMNALTMVAPKPRVIALTPPSLHMSRAYPTHVLPPSAARVVACILQYKAWETTHTWHGQRNDQGTASPLCQQASISPLCASLHMKLHWRTRQVNDMEHEVRGSCALVRKIRLLCHPTMSIPHSYFYNNAHQHSRQCSSQSVTMVHTSRTSHPPALHHVQRVD
jgi:hypothetical protein